VHKIKYGLQLRMQNKWAELPELLEEETAFTKY
jgi:hypothetical protein